ncbi:hypothetical protein [Vibrio europaeus]|uniref:hypothetical protein n=1 Tax=Vibrio europaeus TaxID=300876 RepID=UPI00233F840C|nr:hypothetical protein [Vibrio europaeus]MDC5840426.1 hypothetical protein [Vibrio europaeus]MDC5848504.1 hypothetical protein [Vibrio europaeus]
MKFCILLTLLILPFSSNASITEPYQLDYFSMLMRLFGGLAMFLYGMEKMSDALKRTAGSRMKQVLGTLTTTE